MRAGSRHGESRRSLRIGWVNPRRDNGDNFAVISRLFVYGTLAPGQPNDHVLKSLPGAWESGVVKGRLVQHGWAAEMGFPALVLCEDGLEIEGLLFSSDALPEYWAQLDDFEGPGYERVLARVRRRDGGIVTAYVFVLQEGQDQTGPS
jgi:gamma-glutamylcyclotransferase (GGCT)/AIG2-like uncharacterized protein YtfP